MDLFDHLFDSLKNAAKLIIMGRTTTYVSYVNLSCKTTRGNFHVARSKGRVWSHIVDYSYTTPTLCFAYFTYPILILWQHNYYAANNNTQGWGKLEN